MMKIVRNIMFASLGVTIALVVSCTSDEEARTVFEYFQNNSGEAVRIESFVYGVSESLDTIQDNERFFVCKYTLGVDNGTQFFCHDSVVFIFPNNKGYICGPQDLSLCFPNGKIPLGGGAPGFPNVGGDDFVFTITEEDYLNARDLD